MHIARHNQGLSLAATFRQATLNQQQIQPQFPGFGVYCHEFGLALQASLGSLTVSARPKADKAVATISGAFKPAAAYILLGVS